MKPYPAYKDSGIEWIGDIPEHWEISKAKYHSKIVLGKMLTPNDKGNYQLKSYLKAKNILWEKVDVSEVEEMWFSENEMNQYRLQLKDIVVSEGGEVGRTAIWMDELEECYIQNSVHKVTVNMSHNPRYFLFQFVSHGKRGYFDSIVSRVSIAHLTREKLKEVTVLVPSPEEQQSISIFLDHKTSQIDTLIEKKQRQIELLKEERTAIINQAVTKGLNPDVPMKDSGIEWLGEVPEHWEIKPLKYIAEIVLGKMLTNEDKGDYFYKPYLRAQNIGWEKVNATDIKNMWYSKKELIQYRLKSDDLLISEGGEVGRTAIWNNEIDECYIQNSVHKVTTAKNCNPYYYLYLFILYGKFGFFDSVVSRVSIAHLTREKLKEIRCLVPPLEEQVTIATNLANESQKIEQIILNAEKQITILEEYRTALISNAVTGKIDVRDTPTAILE